MRERQRELEEPDLPACLVGDDAPRHPGKCRGGEDELLLGAGAESEEEGRVPPANPARSARLSRKRVRLSLLPSPPPGDMGSKIARSGEDAVTGRGETLTRSQRPRHPTASLRPRSPALLWLSSTIPTPFSHPLTPPPALSISRFGGSPLVATPAAWAAGRSRSRSSPVLRVFGLPQPLEHLVAGVGVPDVPPGRPDVRLPPAHGLVASVSGRSRGRAWEFS